MLLGLGAITDVQAIIQKIEGYYPGTVAYRNNNPGNLRCQPSRAPFSYQARDGATGCDSSNFAIFPTKPSGDQALADQINIDAASGLTIAQFTNKYAPASDSNDPTSYAASIAAATGLSVNDPLMNALTNGAFDTAVAVGDSGTSDALTQPEMTPGVVFFVGAAALALLVFWSTTR